MLWFVRLWNRGFGADRLPLSFKEAVSGTRERFRVLNFLAPRRQSADFSVHAEQWGEQSRKNLALERSLPSNTEEVEGVVPSWREIYRKFKRKSGRFQEDAWVCSGCCWKVSSNVL